MGFIIAFFVIVLVFACFSKISTAYKYAGVDEELRKIDQMSGVAFEQYCARLLRDCGYFPRASKFTVTKASGDFGVDIVVDLQGGAKVVVQCKRYSKNLGIKPIQEVYAGKNHYGASEAVVMTNSLFTENAIRLARETNVKLIERNSIRAMLAEVNIKARKAKKVAAQHMSHKASGLVSDENYRDLPEVPYVTGMKEYIQMFSDMDVPMVAEIIKNIKAQASCQDKITLVSEVFDTESEAVHFSKAFTRHVCFPAYEIPSSDEKTWFVVVQCVPEYKIAANRRELAGVVFYEFANWG